MAHYAKVNNGIVEQVIVAEADFFDTFVDPNLGQWIQTSYNTLNNIHYGPDGKPDGKLALRGNYAGIGYIYDSENDVFYSQKPYESWVLNKNTWSWEPPIPMPIIEKSCYWDEQQRNWVIQND